MVVAQPGNCEGTAVALLAVGPNVGPELVVPVVLSGGVGVAHEQTLATLENIGEQNVAAAGGGVVLPRSYIVQNWARGVETNLLIADMQPSVLHNARGESWPRNRSSPLACVARIARTVTAMSRVARQDISILRV